MDSFQSLEHRSCKRLWACVRRAELIPRDPAEPRNLVRRGPAIRQNCPRTTAMEVPSESRAITLRLWVVTPTKVPSFGVFVGVNNVTNSAKRLARGLGRSQPQTQRRPNRLYRQHLAEMSFHIDWQTSCCIKNRRRTELCAKSRHYLRVHISRKSRS